MSTIKWTHSSDNNVRACHRRAFYISRFAHWSGADGTPRREAFLLQQAIDVPLWRGNLVHKTIERCVLPMIKKGENPDFDVARAWLLQLIEKQAEFSRLAKFREQSRNESKDVYCVLREDLCGDGVTPEQMAEVTETSLLALSNLETSFSDLLRRAKYAKDLAVEYPIRFKIDDQIRMEAIPDLIFFEVGKGAAIVDWKAGFNPNANAREQLHVYAYAVLRSGFWAALTHKEIELIEANLVTGERFEYRVTEDDIDDVDDRIFTGAQQLEPIVTSSIKDYRPEDFEAAQSPGSCEHCVVRGICDGTRSQEKTAFPLFSAEFV